MAHCDVADRLQLHFDPLCHAATESMIDINTNAVPWYEYPASLCHAAGLTLREAGFVKLNGILTVMMVIMHYTVVGFVTSTWADALVNMMPVPVDKVPFLVIAVLPIIASLCAIIGSAYGDSHATPNPIPPTLPQNPPQSYTAVP